MSRISPKLRSQVVHRAEGRCEYCQLPTEGQVAWFPVDHVFPHSRGGRTELANLALSCPRCNGRKWAHEQAVDPETSESVLLFNPRVQEWDDHFQFSDQMRIEGKTMCRRATVELLQMNEPNMLHIRSLLASFGVFSTRRDA